MRLAACALLIAGCGATQAGTRAAAPVEPAEPAQAAPSRWAEATRSPWALGDLDERARALTAACGEADGALARVAARLAAEHGPPDPDRATSWMRAAGEPHVRPRVVVATTRGQEDDDAVRAQLEASRTPRARCGLAIAPAEGGERLVAIAVDAVAELDPLPTRARTGEWLTLSATLLAPASRARVVVLGPRGLPRNIPTTLDASGAVRARFALDRPGAFTIQLVADREAGPEPVLEARVFADVAPPVDPEDAPAPGEELGAEPNADDATLLARMIDAVREADGLRPLARDVRLDALARAHAGAMVRAQTVAHDLGDGDLARRAEAAGVSARAVGENVAHARTVARAHRVLHASPSHRMNLLGDYTHVGVAVVRDDAGDAWACEVFARGPR